MFPAIITIMAVIGTIPEYCSVRENAIAVVRDFGSREIYSTWPILNKMHRI